ncbi:MAG: YdjY domain-containing protein, partial [Phycisphaerae bacterium]
MKRSIRVMAGVVLAVALLSGCAAPGGVGKAALPGIVVEQRSQTLQVEGKVCIEEGILEYLAVAEGGKEYESVFALDCRPSHLQAAMLIAGYEAGEVAPELRGDLSPQADPAANPPPEGAPQVTRPSEEYFAKAAAEPTRVTIDVDVRQSDATWQRRPIEHFLIDRSTGRLPPRLTWAFTGSFFYRDEQTRLEFFVADTEKSLIALWYDPTALLNLTQDVGNPYRGDGAGFELSAANLPGKGTPIRLILHRLAGIGCASRQRTDKQEKATQTVLDRPSCCVPKLPRVRRLALCSMKRNIGMGTGIGARPRLHNLPGDKTVSRQPADLLGAELKGKGHVAGHRESAVSTRVNNPVRDGRLGLTPSSTTQGDRRTTRESWTPPTVAAETHWLACFRPQRFRVAVVRSPEGPAQGKRACKAASCAVQGFPLSELERLLLHWGDIGGLHNPRPDS